MNQHSNYLIEGFKLIVKPGIKRYVIIPLLINILLFTCLLIVSIHYFGQLNVWIEQHLPHWLRWLGWILWVIFYIGFFVMMVYTFATVANLISAPFNNLLSEKVEFYLTGKKHAEKTWVENIKDTPRVIGRQLGLIAYYLPRALLILILFFIPIVQIVAPLLWFVFNAWYMALQYIDYPTDNHQIPLPTVHVWLKQRRSQSFQFGINVMIVSMIPILNFIVVPAAVAGATKYYVEAN